MPDIAEHLILKSKVIRRFLWIADKNHIMQVSITGATGFIGKRLLRYYEQQGDIVHILTRQSLGELGKNTKVFRLDLLNCTYDELSAFVQGSDIVYHCAAEFLDSAKIFALNL